MNLRKRENPRTSLNDTGWRAWRTSSLLPVAGEVFLLTLPFIERANRPCGLRRKPDRALDVRFRDFLAGLCQRHSSLIRRLRPQGPCRPESRRLSPVPALLPSPLLEPCEARGDVRYVQ